MELRPLGEFLQPRQRELKPEMEKKKLIIINIKHIGMNSGF